MGQVTDLTELEFAARGENAQQHTLATIGFTNALSIKPCPP